MKQEIKEGRGNVQIHGDGNHVTLASDVIYQVITGIRTGEDIDPSIISIRQHVEKLQLHKGLRDARILLLILVTVGFSAALFRWDVYSIPLAALGGLGLYWGQKQERFITRINTEMAAGNAVLIELYKQKLLRQIEDNKLNEQTQPHNC